MTQGKPIERKQKELVWKLIHQGIRNFKQISTRTGVHPATVRDVCLDGCSELYGRLMQDAKAARIDETCDPH